MNNNPGPVLQEEHATPYSQNGGSLSLSGPALAGLTRDIVDRGIPFRFTAPGFSMSPFIRDGDIITIAPCKAASCRTGDVVAFIRPGSGRLIVHRVVAVSAGGCRIRGDNTSEEDGMIPHASIVGQVIRIEHAGKVIRFGLGPERIIIALFSRQGWLRYCTGAAGAACSLVRKLI
jgi:signal peptidase I